MSAAYNVFDFQHGKITEKCYMEPATKGLALAHLHSFISCDLT